MASLDVALEHIVRKIRENEKERKRVSDSIRAVKKEEGFFFGIKPLSPLTARVVGVDGGLLACSYHGIDLITTRAVGVYFDYDKGKLKGYSYFPSPSPSPEIFPITESVSEPEFSTVANLLRVSSELGTAVKSARKFEPACLILHGSIAPYPSNKPQKESFAKGIYEEMVSCYLELYGYCNEKKITLFGVVEDSRGTRFSDIMRKRVPEIGKRMRDTTILFDALEHGERTFAFSYSSKPEEIPTLSDLKGWGGRLYSFYAKTAKYDRPIRVDFLAEDGTAESVEETANKIASYVFTLSSFSRNYGLPTVLIEADCRAKLREDEMDIIYGRIADEAGPSPLSMHLRRENRPF